MEARRETDGKKGERLERILGRPERDGEERKKIGYIWKDDTHQP